MSRRLQPNSLSVRCNAEKASFVTAVWLFREIRSRCHETLLVEPHSLLNQSPCRRLPAEMDSLGREVGCKSLPLSPVYVPTHTGPQHRELQQASKTDPKAQSPSAQRATTGVLPFAKAPPRENEVGPNYRTITHHPPTPLMPDCGYEKNRQNLAAEKRCLYPGSGPGCRISSDNSTTCVGSRKTTQKPNFCRKKSAKPSFLG